MDAPSLHRQIRSGCTPGAIALAFSSSIKLPMRSPRASGSGQTRRFSRQRPDHVMIINARGALAADARQPLNQLSGEVDR
jgi:hypothetical protein